MGDELRQSFALLPPRAEPWIRITKPGLVRFHYPSGIDSLAHIVTKMCRHFFAAANIPVISVGQITAQQCKCEAVATKLVAGTSQLRLISVDAQRSEQFRASIVR